MAMKIPTKIGVQTDVTRSDAMLWTVRIAFIVVPSAQIGFFVVELKVDQRAEHLQIRDQRIHLGRRAALAVEIARYGLWIALGECIRASVIGIGLRLEVGDGI